MAVRKKLYEALTGIEDSYERCLRGVVLLRDRGLPLKLKTVPTTVNKHEVVATRTSQSRSCISISSSIRSSTRASIAPRVLLRFGYRLRKGPSRSALAENRSRAPGNGAAGFEAILGVGTNRHGVFLRWGDRFLRPRSLRAHEHLRAVPSGYVRHPFGIGEGRLGVIPPEGTCPGTETNFQRVKCRIRSLCSMCPANGELENGDAESPVDFLCEVCTLARDGIGSRCAGARRMRFLLGWPTL